MGKKELQKPKYSKQRNSPMLITSSVLFLKATQQKSGKEGSNFRVANDRGSPLQEQS